MIGNEMTREQYIEAAAAAFDGRLERFLNDGWHRADTVVRDCSEYRIKPTLAEQFLEKFRGKRVRHVDMGKGDYFVPERIKGDMVHGQDNNCESSLFPSRWLSLDNWEEVEQFRPMTANEFPDLITLRRREWGDSEFLVANVQRGALWWWNNTGMASITFKRLAEDDCPWTARDGSRYRVAVEVPAE